MFSTIRRRVGLVACGFVLAGLVGCSTNPTTGRMQLNSLSPAQEIAIGSEAAPQLIQEYGGAVQDPYLQGYVAQIGMRMVPYTEGDAPNLPWEFVLLDSDVINAFALPGGKVFMSRGLAERMTNEAQLASVIGHEIGHVTARHINERVTQQRVVGGLLTAGVLVAGRSDSAIAASAVEQIMGTAGQGFLLRFGREQEIEADSLGVRYMVRTNYDPMGAIEVQNILAQASAGTRPPEFLSTHPYPESRIANLQNLIRGEYAFTQNNPQFQLHEERFRNSFLNRLAALPPAPDASFETLAVADWCGLCRDGH